MTLKRIIDEPAVGMRILMAENSGWKPERSLWDIASYDDTTINLVRRSNPEEVQQISRGGLRGRGYEAIWTHAIPDLPEECLVEIYRLLEKSRYTNHAFLFEVGERDEKGNSNLELIDGSTSDSDATKNLSTLQLHVDFAEKARDSDPVLKRYTQGAVILLRPTHTFDADVDRVILTEGDAVETGMNREQAEEFIKIETGPFRMPAWPIGDAEALEMEVGHCISKHEKDMVIAMILDTGSLAKPDTAHSVLHVTGSKLYWDDTIADELWGTPLGHGIWIGTEISWHDAGDDGAEWDAAWRRAKISDMREHGLTFDEVVETAADQLERDLTLADVHALFAEEWSDIRHADTDHPEDGTDAHAKAWIESVSDLIPHVTDKQVTREETETGGSVFTLKQGKRVFAVANVQHLAGATSVLTRWADEDIRDRIFDREIAEWKVKPGQ